MRSQSTYALILAALLCAARVLPAQNGLPGQSQPRAADPGRVSMPTGSQVLGDNASPEERRHATPEWQSLEKHLPDLNTASPQQLETAADVLRARRFPEESLMYYQAALKRGGRPVVLWNKLGVTQLELQQLTLARTSFRHVVQMDKKNADGWNNLGAVEYLQRNFGTATDDYKKAVKFNQKSAVFHSNLANAYFSDKNLGKARKEFAQALALDPHVFEYGGTAGMQMHLQTPENRARFCYELARQYARQGDDANTLHWLAMATEAGFDIREEIRGDAMMVKYRKDPRIAELIKNGRLLDEGTSAPAAGTKVAPLPETTATPVH